MSLRPVLRPVLRDPFRAVGSLRAGGGRFTPAARFSAGQKGLWWAPDDFTRLFQNSNGTTAVVAGDPIGYMGDKSPNGLNAVQATASARPTETAAIYAQSYDGGDNLSTATFAAGTLGSSMDCFFAFKCSDADGAIMFDGGGGRLFGFFGAGFGNPATQLSGSTSTYYVDGVAVAGGTATTATQFDAAIPRGVWCIIQVRDLDLSAWTQVKTGGNGGLFLSGSSLGDVVICPSGTAGERAQVADYLAKKYAVTATAPLDVFVVAGQSNTYSGLTFDSTLDTSSTDIFEYTQAGQIVCAIDPLSHFNNPARASGGRIGFAMYFAKAYVAATGRKVLIVPCGLGGTGFSSAPPDAWTAGTGTLRDRTIQRANAAMTYSGGATFKGILWHQGESDSSLAASYGTLLDALIADLRASIIGASTAPFVCGGMADTYVAANPTLAGVQSALAAVPTRNSKAGFASSSTPTSLAAGVGAEDAHFTAASQRILGQRYYDAYVAALSDA